MTQENLYKVLMVDDEQAFLFSMALAFKNYKHIQFLTAESTAEGSRLALEEKPHLILLDLKIADTNGEDLLRDLKKSLPNTKFMVISASGDEATLDRLKEAGADVFYAKPIDLKAVITKIINLLMLKERP